MVKKAYAHRGRIMDTVYILYLFCALTLSGEALAEFDGSEDYIWHNCETSPCLNSGTCFPLDIPEAYVCACLPNYSGPECQTEIEPVPKQNRINFIGAPNDTFQALNCETSHPSLDGVDENGFPYAYSIRNNLTYTATPKVSYMCLVLSPELDLEPGKPYNFTVGFQSYDPFNIDGALTVSGAIFNVLDEENFDFIIFQIFPPSELSSNEMCYVIGFVSNGIITYTFNDTCGSYALKTNEHYTVFGSVGIQASIRFQENFEIISDPPIEWTPHFKANGRIGLSSVNYFQTLLILDQLEIMQELDDSSPKIDHVFPTYGPVAGGTTVTLSGSHLIANYHPDKIYLRPVVYIGNRLCIHKSYDFNKIVVETPAFNDSAAMTMTLTPEEKVVGNEIPFSVILRNEDRTYEVPVTSSGFTYKSNPSIGIFYPKDMIVEGGTEITVEGEDLDSVAVHMIIITMVHLRTVGGMDTIVNTRTFTSKCQVVSKSRMICITPKLELPPQFVSLTPEDSLSRKKRNHHFHRMRREEQTIISQRNVSDERLEFYVSFKSDGVTVYEEETSKNAIRVFANPKFNKFEPLVQFYDPNHWNDRITIKGKYLNVGARKNDYVINIGKETCSDIVLTDNRVSCLPPGKEPEDPSDMSRSIRRSGQPHVMVTVGNLENFIGHLDYTGERNSVEITVHSVELLLLSLWLIVCVC